MQIGGISNSISFPPWYLQTSIIKCWGLIAKENKFQWREFSNLKLKVFCCDTILAFFWRKFISDSMCNESLKKIKYCQAQPSKLLSDYVHYWNTELWLEWSKELLWLFSCARKCLFWIFRRVAVFSSVILIYPSSVSLTWKTAELFRRHSQRGSSNVGQDCTGSQNPYLDLSQMYGWVVSGGSMHTCGRNSGLVKQIIQNILL